MANQLLGDRIPYDGIYWKAQDRSRSRLQSSPCGHKPDNPPAVVPNGAPCCEYRPLLEPNKRTGRTDTTNATNCSRTAAPGTDGSNGRTLQYCQLVNLGDFHSAKELAPGKRHISEGPICSDCQKETVIACRRAEGNAFGGRHRPDGFQKEVGGTEFVEEFCLAFCEPCETDLRAKYIRGLNRCRCDPMPTDRRWLCHTCRLSALIRRVNVHQQVHEAMLVAKKSGHREIRDKEIRWKHTRNLQHNMSGKNQPCRICGDRFEPRPKGGPRAAPVHGRHRAGWCAYCEGIVVLPGGGHAGNPQVPVLRRSRRIAKINAQNPALSVEAVPQLIKLQTVPTTKGKWWFASTLRRA